MATHNHPAPTPDPSLPASLAARARVRRGDRFEATFPQPADMSLVAPLGILLAGKHRVSRTPEAVAPTRIPLVRPGVPRLRSGSRWRHRP